MENYEFSTTENIDTLSSKLNGVDQLTSTPNSGDAVLSEMHMGEMVSSQLNEQDQIDSELDQPTVHKYTGGETDNIIVNVDNDARVITATLKPIKFKTVADFPVVGSDRLLYIDATENSLYSWDSDIGEYRKLVADTGEVDVDLSNYYTKEETDGVVSQTLSSAKSYTDTKVAELIDSAPETLDTFKEIADAFAEDQEVLDALNSAIGLKAGKSDLEATNTRVTSLEGSVATLESDKVDKVEGKGLSTNDLTDDLLGKINNNTVIEITESNVHIKDLGSGIYKLPMGCTFSFYATEKFVAPSESYLFVTETNEGRREFFIFCSDYYQTTGIGNKYLVSGYAYIPSAVGYSYKFIINKNYVDTSTDQTAIYGNKTFVSPVKMTGELSQTLDDETLVTAEWTNDRLDKKQDALEAGNGITIEGNKISASLGDGAQIIKLPSPVHIYNLDSGVYQLPAGCELYYNDSYASGEEHYYRINYVNESETILFVQTTEYYATQKSDRKLFVLFAENDSYGKRGSEGSFIVGVATATGGSNHIAGVDTSIYIPREGDALVYGTKTFQSPTKYSSALSLDTSLNDRTLVDAQWVKAQGFLNESDLADKGYITKIPSEYVTETELDNKGYLTSVPSEYVTETELTNKGYATNSSLNATNSNVSSIGSNVASLNTKVNTLSSDVNTNTFAISSFKNSLLSDSGLLDRIFPIHSIFLSIGATPPGQLFGGNWVELDAGYALWTASSNGGSKISAGLPNITGSLSARILCGSGQSASGAFTSSGYGTGVWKASGSDPAFNLGFDASKMTNSLYGKSTTVQPPAFTVRAWRRLS